MIYMSTQVLKKFRSWERASQIALGLALILLLAVVLVILFGPFELRQPAVIGCIGLVIVMQMTILWASRGMVTEYTQAQRYYLRENFEAARDLLEELRTTNKADFRVLTLLGNTYRQLGELDQSEVVLQEALRLEPNHHFSLYGFGRTLLVQGRYGEAAHVLAQALAAGAPPIVQLDLGEAYYRQGMSQQASEQLQAALLTTDEAYRLLMAKYLLYQLHLGERPEGDLLYSGLPYWQAASERYHYTVYGQALADDILLMHQLLKET